MKFGKISNIYGGSETYNTKCSSRRTINIGDYVQIFSIDNLYNRMNIEKKDIITI